MLRYRRLRDPHPRNDIADRPFLTIVEKADDLSTSGLRDCIEDIGSGCCPSHEHLYSYIGMFVKRGGSFCLPDKLPSSKKTVSDGQWN
jgi:hypothetical protein